jgi:hypothetical protein
MSQREVSYCGNREVAQIASPWRNTPHLCNILISINIFSKQGVRDNYWRNMRLFLFYPTHGFIRRKLMSSIKNLHHFSQLHNSVKQKDPLA